MLKNPYLKEELDILLDQTETKYLVTWFGDWKNKDGELDQSIFVDKVILWGHTFLHQYFIDETPEFHRDLIGRFFSNTKEYVAAPRGFSKTTILQLCIAFSIVYNLDNFIVIIEKSFTESSEVLSAIHGEFLENEMIIHYYGNLVSRKYYTANTRRMDIRNKLKPSEAKGDVTINGIRVRALGFNKTIRGLKSRQHRPSRIICDDIEEDEHINNPEQRIKYMNNYNRGIQPATDIKGTVKVFGTILHVDSLLQNLINSHNGVVYAAHDGDSPDEATWFLWPERWDRETLKAKRSDMINDNQSTAAYAQEYLNKPQSEEDRKFPFNWLWEVKEQPNGQKYHIPVQRVTMQEFENLRKKTPLNGYAMIDMADSTTEGADWIGAVVIFVAPNGARFRVDVRREKRNVLDAIKLIFEIWEKWAPKGLLKIGIEKKAFEDQVKPLIELEKDKRVNVFPVVEELKPMGRKKENRILGALQGLYESGKMISVCEVLPDGKLKPVGHTNELLQELYDFPGAKHDDLSDAEAYQSDLVTVPMAEEAETHRHVEPQNDPFEYNNSGSYQGKMDDPNVF